MEEEKRGRQIDLKPSRNESIDVINERIMKHIEEQTQENLQKIGVYNSAINQQIKGLDVKLDQIVRKLQQDFIQSYQSWTKQKEKEFKETVHQLKEKYENKNAQEKKIKELTINLKLEEDKRIELSKQKDKLDQDNLQYKRLSEKYKDEALTYKAQAIEDRKKLRLVEEENKNLTEQIQNLKGKIREEKHQTSLILLNSSTLSMQLNLNFGDSQLDNQGNQTKFKAFIESLLNNDLRNPEIKKELINFFTILELGYRERIVRLQSQLRELQASQSAFLNYSKKKAGTIQINSNIVQNSGSRMSPHKSSVIIEKPHQFTGANASKLFDQDQIAPGLKQGISRNASKQNGLDSNVNKSQIVGEMRSSNTDFGLHDLRNSHIYNDDNVLASNHTTHQKSTMNENEILIAREKLLRRSFKKNSFKKSQNLHQNQDQNKSLSNERNPNNDNTHEDVCLIGNEIQFSQRDAKEPVLDPKKNRNTSQKNLFPQLDQINKALQKEVSDYALDPLMSYRPNKITKIEVKTKIPGFRGGSVLRNSKYKQEVLRLKKRCTREKQNRQTTQMQMIHQGEEFPDLEKSQTFFNVTKLFQVNTPGIQSLRRLMYVFIKELKANENEVFVVINMLMKDVSQSENEMYKANALRVLTKIMDDQYVQTLEKFLKQALIDKSNHVVSAALVSLLNLYKKGGHAADISKKSVNELQDKLLNSGDGNLQYQSLIILYEIKKNDAMAVMRLLFQLTQTKLYNSITKCQLIRYIKLSLISIPSIDARTVKTFIGYIESCLTKEDDPVQFEAAKTMCELFEIFGGVIDVETPFQVLIQLASSSSKPVNKYAALRVMNRVASKQPTLVGLCQSDLENLITDMNRSVASLAISTLLKTCNEDSVQKLLKQISHYLPDLGLDFKIETIESTALLYHRLPNKADVLLKFLTDCLKDEGNQQFREAVVDTIIEICPSQRESALMILAEHIEDCEHAHIQTKIINFLAEEGPKSKNPSSFIRFIYNRVNLEKAVIRAAAVSALASFAHKVPSLRKNILLLLQKCLSDSDDEVRERAFFFIKLLEDQSTEYILGDDYSTENYNSEENQSPPVPVEEVEKEKEELRDFIFGGQGSQQIDIDALEAYVLQNRDQLIAQEDGLQIDLTNMMATKKRVTKKNKILEEGQSASGSTQNSQKQEEQKHPQVMGQQQQVQSQPQKVGAQEVDPNFQEMVQNPDLQELLESSKHLYSSLTTPLTDSSSEYQVQTTKHFFEQFIIVQYAISNTLEEHILSKVKLIIQGIDSPQNLQLFSIANLKDSERIKYNEKKFIYAIFTKENCEHPFPQAKVQQKLSINITEIEIDSQDEIGTYEEDYKLEDLQIAVRDYVRPFVLPTGTFKDIWERIGADVRASEAIQTYQLPFKSSDEAVQNMIKFFGMSVCEGSDKVNVTEKVHNLFLSGLFFGQESVLVRIQIGFNQELGCVIKVTIRSLNSIISNTLLDCIQ